MLRSMNSLTLTQLLLEARSPPPPINCHPRVVVVRSVWTPGGQPPDFTLRGFALVLAGFGILLKGQFRYLEVT